MQERPLTAREAAFVDAYLQCGNAAEAARRAGYSVGSAKQAGHRVLRRAKVTAEVTLRGDLKATSSDLTQEWIEGELKRLAQEGERDSDKIQALRLLGKQRGMFVERTHITSDEPPVDDELCRMSEADLDAVIKDLDG